MHVVHNILGLHNIIIHLGLYLAWNSLMLGVCICVLTSEKKSILTLNKYFGAFSGMKGVNESHRSHRLTLLHRNPSNMCKYIAYI